MREWTPASEHFLCEEFGGAFIGWAVELCALKNKVAKKEISFLLNAPGHRIKEDLIQRPKIIREKFAKPFFTNARDLRQEDDQFVIPPLDLANLAGHEQGTLLYHAFPSEDAVSVVDEIAAKRAGIDAFSQMIRKSD